MSYRNDQLKYLGILGCLVAVLFGASVALQAVPMAVASTSNTFTANVAVSGACYTLALPSTITFGNTITPPYSTYTNVVVTDNDVGGNLASYLQIKGANWAGPVTVNVDNTLWSASSQSSFTGTALTTAFANTAIYMPAPTIAASTTTNSIYFGVNIPGGLPAGTYTEAITFNNLCSSSATNVVTANFVVASVCYTSLSTTSVTFGTMSPGSNYNTNVVVVDSDNGGNADAYLNVKGIDWSDGGDNFYVANTMWAPASQSSFTGTRLGSSIYANTAILIPSPSLGTPTTSNSIYFGVSVPGGTPVGTYTQTITMENAC